MALTTARELAAELKRFAADLNDTADQLRAELAEMVQAEAEIKRELHHTAAKFVGNTITELEGDGFDTTAEIAQTIEELGSQGLTFFRTTLTENSERALKAVNETLDQTVDPQGFQIILEDAEQKYRIAAGTADKAQGQLTAARAALKKWKDASVEDDLVDLDDAIATKGGLRLNSDNRSFYEPPNIFVAVGRYLRSSSYRSVRRALEAYGHGRDGKDAFGDLANFREEYKRYNQDINAAQTAFNEAEGKKDTAAAAKDRFAGFARDIKTDAQILQAVQDKVVKDLIDCPAFITAMASHFEEDFPRNLPFLVAKLNTLDKLAKGTEGKLEDVQAKYTKVTDQYQKLSRLQQSIKVKTDLDALRRNNAAHSAECQNYTKAARRAWQRAKEASYEDYHRHGGEAGRNSTDLFQTMLIYQMLTSGSRDRYDRVPSKNELADDSRFAADLMGVDKDAARKAGLPDEAFDISPATAREMSDFGVSDYKPGTLAFDIGKSSSSRNAGLAFDIVEPPRPSSSSSSPSIGSTFGSSSRRSGGGGSSFKIGGSSSRNSPGSGGGRKGGGGGSFKI